MTDAPDRDDALWQELYVEMTKTFTEVFGVPTNAAQIAYVEAITDIAYDASKVMQKFTEERFEVRVASASELDEWEKANRMSPKVTITIKGRE